MSPTAVAAVSTVEPDERLIREAEDRGRRRQEVDSRLDGHDEHLRRINGSIDRAARAQERSNEWIGGVEKAVTELGQKIETSTEVQEALRKAAASRRDLYIAVAAIVATLLGAVIGVHAF